MCVCVCVCGAAKPGSKQITLARLAIVCDAKKTKSSVQLLMEGWEYPDISGKYANHAYIKSRMCRHKCTMESSY